MKSFSSNLKEKLKASFVEISLFKLFKMNLEKTFAILIPFPPLTPRCHSNTCKLKFSWIQNIRNKIKQKTNDFDTTNPSSMNTEFHNKQIPDLFLLILCILYDSVQSSSVIQCLFLHCSAINLNLKIFYFLLNVNLISILVSSFFSLPFNGQRNIGKFSGLAQQNEAVEATQFPYYTFTQSIVKNCRPTC